MSRKGKGAAGGGALHVVDDLSQGTSEPSSRRQTPQSLDVAADRLIADMVEAGAVDIETDGRERWHHGCAPGSRDALRRIKAAADLNRPGFAAAICRAILRMKREIAA